MNKVTKYVLIGGVIVLIYAAFDDIQRDGSTPAPSTAASTLNTPAGLPLSSTPPEQQLLCDILREQGVAYRDATTLQRRSMREQRKNRLESYFQETNGVITGLNCQGHPAGSNCKVEPNDAIDNPSMSTVDWQNFIQQELFSVADQQPTHGDDGLYLDNRILVSNRHVLGHIKADSWLVEVDSVTPALFGQAGAQLRLNLCSTPAGYTQDQVTGEQKPRHNFWVVITPLLRTPMIWDTDPVNHFATIVPLKASDQLIVSGRLLINTPQLSYEFDGAYNASPDFLEIGNLTGSGVMTSPQIEFILDDIRTY